MADVFITLCMISYLRLSAQGISSATVADNVFAGLPDFIENSTNASALVSEVCKVAGSLIPSCPDFLGSIIEDPEELSGFVVGYVLKLHECQESYREEVEFKLHFSR